MADDTGAAWTAVDAGERHGTRLGPRLRFETEIHGVLGNGSS